MTVRNIKILRIVLLFLFLILAPIFVLYAYGWRMDFEKLRPVKVGGVFLRSLPTDANLTINGKPVKKRSHKLLTGALIGNLLPGNYTIQIEKYGYQKWRKEVLVAPALVFETTPIILPPLKKPELFFEESVQDFWINGSVLIYHSADGNFYLAKIGDLSSRTNLSLMFNSLKEKILKFPGVVPILGIVKQESSNEWVVRTAKASYLLDFKKLTLELLEKPIISSGPEAFLRQFPLLSRWEKDYAGGSIKKISSYSDDKHLFATVGEKLFFLELGDPMPLNVWLIAENVKKHEYESGRIYFLKNDKIYSLGI